MIEPAATAPTPAAPSLGGDVVAGADGRSRSRAVVARLVAVAKPLAAFAVILGAWELWAATRDVPSFVLPAPSDIADYAAGDLSLLLRHGRITLREVGIAFGISLVVGVVLAVLIVRFKLLADTLLPLLVTTQVVPTVAVAPVLVVWLGFGDSSKIAVAVLISFFPILINTITGLRAVDRELNDLARSLCASRGRVLRYLALPVALPYLFAGARVSITLAVIGAVVGEFVAADQGLGALVLRGNARLEPELMWAAVFCLAILGIALFNLVRLAEWFAVPWRRSATDS